MEMKFMQIEIVQGNITEQDVDAIVNAAHEALQSGGGVDGAIHRAAGPSLLRACREIPEVEPFVRCRPGEAHITIAGNLKARHVVHTVAPRFVGSVSKAEWDITKNIYKNAKPGTEVELANCYRNTIRLAGANNLESIAFCSLGTGGHSWPIEIGCPLAIQTVLETIPDAPSLKLVRFVCFGDSDFEFYKATYEKIKGQN
jgi:O-acetyl-ADP-ribose deacetylase